MKIIDLIILLLAWIGLGALLSSILLFFTKGKVQESDDEDEDDI